MCKFNLQTDSRVYREETNSAKEFHYKKLIAYTRVGAEPDPENLLQISKRKQRHLNNECLMKQMLIENIVKQLKLEVNKKYICEFNFSADYLSVL